MDGIASTAWRVARGADPTGEWLRLDFGVPTDLGSVRLVQPDGARSITGVTMTSENGTQQVALTGRTHEIATDLGTSSWLDIRVDSVDPGPVGAPADGVGFAEVSLGSGIAGDEVIVLPSLLDSVADELDPGVPLSIVMTRERADRPERDRRDPEARIVRELSLPMARTMDLIVTARADAGSIDTGCRDDVLHIDGVAVPLHVHGDASELSVERCGDIAPLDLAAGAHRVETSVADGFTIDRIVLQAGSSPSPPPAPDVAVTEASRTQRTATVGPCPAGCWFVLGEGLGEGWNASIDGASAGPATFVDGGMNGWWMEPSSTSRVVDLTWTPQRTTNVAIMLTAATVLACLLLLLTRRRVEAVPVDEAPGAFVAIRGARARAPWPLVVGAGVLALVVISPLYAVLAAACLLVLGRPLWLGAVPLAVMTFVGLGYVARLVVSDAQPSFGWVGPVEWAHRPTLVALLLLAAAVTDRQRPANVPPP